MTADGAQQMGGSVDFSANKASTILKLAIPTGVRDAHAVVGERRR